MSIRTDACGDPLNIEGEGLRDDEPLRCDLCGDHSDELVEAGEEFWCVPCCEAQTREHLEDDGVQYSDPRDEQDERRRL